jgi:hypothetical protein
MLSGLVLMLWGGTGSSASTIKWICPMGCPIGEQVAAGRCPKCGMDLVESRGGKVAHRDHQPKHGGFFFMAPDGKHHLEGTLPEAHQFRLYLYDQFTDPSSEPVSGEIEVNGGKVALEAGPRFYQARLPSSLAPPYQLTAHVRFAGARESDVFDFDFPSVKGE